MIRRHRGGGAEAWTVFRKQRMRESAEIERAWRAMRRCVAEAHTADEE